MKLELIGHDEKYALEQSLLTLFPGEKPVYGTVDKTADTRWARVTLTEEDERVQVTTELGVDGKSAAHSYDYPLSGTEYEKEGQRRHAVGISFFGATKDLLGISPAWGSLTGVRPAKVALSLIREGGKKRAEKELQELYCVTPARARLAIEAADAGIRAAAELEPNDISLYVGIPFCPTRCSYCSFVSESIERFGAFLPPYLEALHREIAYTGKLLADSGYHIRSLYMGGGTPTTLSSAQMKDLLRAIKDSFDLSRCLEFTVEGGRPDTLDEEKLRVIHDGGATRISINPQTMADDVLAAVGRKHTAAQTVEAFRQARAVGFEDINMDLIAGLPEDTPEKFAASLSQVLALNPSNVTVHTLALKKGANLFQNRTVLPTNEDVSQMLSGAETSLRAHSFVPYYLYRQKYMSGSFENTGWCRPGFTGWYNIYMMEELHTILSLGGGGMNKISLPAGQLERFHNPKSPQDYIARIDTILHQKDEIFEILHKLAQQPAPNEEECE